jgi:hypothetical protein
VVKSAVIVKKIPRFSHFFYFQAKISAVGVRHPAFQIQIA